MTESAHLAEALVGLVTDPEAGWFTPVVYAIKGLAPEQAAQVPAKGFNSVWGNITHMSYWMEFVLLKFKGEPTDQLEKEGKVDWPEFSAPFSEEDWIRDKARLVEVTKSLAAEVARFSEAELEEPYAPGKAKRYQLIQGVIGHNCYHTNEIISIRHMLGYWLDRT